MRVVQKVLDSNYAYIRYRRLKDMQTANTSAQSDQGPHCSLTESLDITECMNGDQMPGWGLGQAQDNVHPHILRMLEGTLSLDEAQYVITPLDKRSITWLYCIIWAASSENVPSSMPKCRLRFIPRMGKVSRGHLLSIDTFYSDR